MKYSQMAAEMFDLLRSVFENEIKSQKQAVFLVKRYLALKTRFEGSKNDE